jgi:hypothetical protein
LICPYKIHIEKCYNWYIKIYRESEQVVKEKSMRIKHIWFKILVLGLLCITIILNYFSKKNNKIIEEYFSNGINKYMRQKISIFTGMIPFSIMELLCLVSIITVILGFIRMIIRIRKKEFLNFLTNVVIVISVVYLLFMYMWAFNYNRLSIDKIIGLDLTKSTKSDLKGLCEELVKRANELRVSVAEDKNGVFELKENNNKIYDDINEEFKTVSIKYNVFSGNYGNTKSIYFSQLMSYTGMTGIYCPFTCEANININEHDLLLPATTAHEQAHQRGFAKEDEAGYIGYMVCSQSNNASYKYSGTMMALFYAINQLASADNSDYSEIVSKYSDGIKRDIKSYNDLWSKYSGKVQKTTKKLNDTYLKANGEADGEASYGRLVDLLLAEYKKYGKV